MTLTSAHVPSSPIHPTRHAALLIASLAMLSACGGGGSNDNSPGVPAQQAQAQATRNAPKLAAAPSAWQILVGEGEAFTVPEDTLVRYGREDIGWVVKKVSGRGSCSNDFFGFDTQTMGYRHCYVDPAVANPRPAPVPVPVPAPTPDPTPIANADAQALALVNEFRAAPRTCGSKNFPAVPPLKWSAQLASAAQSHSQDMVLQNYFEHQNLNNQSPGARALAAGYPSDYVWENIAAGQPTLPSVIDAWKTSPGHCAGMMEKSVTEMGLGRANNNGSARYSVYWTLDLGNPGF
jgi:uncharacterized protein YkwD